jgi:hypothetical protein
MRTVTMWGRRPEDAGPNRRASTALEVRAGGSMG